MHSAMPAREDAHGRSMHSRSFQSTICPLCAPQRGCKLVDSRAVHGGHNCFMATGNFLKTAGPVQLHSSLLGNVPCFPLVDLDEHSGLESLPQFKNRKSSRLTQLEMCFLQIRVRRKPWQSECTTSLQQKYQLCAIEILIMV